jgi:hypothetical protein
MYNNNALGKYLVPLHTTGVDSINWIWLHVGDEISTGCTYIYENMVLCVIQSKNFVHM